MVIVSERALIIREPRSTLAQVERVKEDLREVEALKSGLTPYAGGGPGAVGH